MASVKQPFISGGIIMNIWENAVLTDKGTALQAKLIQGQTLKISRVTTGSKKVPIVDLRQQTDVTEGGYDITLQPSRTEGEKTILPVLLENTSLKESYDLWQVGFFAEDPEEGEILYCLAQASEARHIPSATEGPGFSITWDFVIKTSNTTPFEVDLDSVGLVSIEQYQVHTGEIHSLKNSIVNLDRKFEVLNSALLNKQSYPDYSKIKIAISDGVGTKTYTCTEDGFIQFIGSSGNKSVKPEIDLRINNIGVFTYRTGYQTTYVKATSGLFPVKSGDVIECIIQSSFVTSESVRFYPLRY